MTLFILWIVCMHFHKRSSHSLFPSKSWFGSCLWAHYLRFWCIISHEHVILIRINQIDINHTSMNAHHIHFLVLRTYFASFNNSLQIRNNCCFFSFRSNRNWCDSIEIRSRNFSDLKQMGNHFIYNDWYNDVFFQRKHQITHFHSIKSSTNAHTIDTEIYFVFSHNIWIGT